MALPIRLASEVDGLQLLNPGEVPREFLERVAHTIRLQAVKHGMRKVLSDPEIQTLITDLNTNGDSKVRISIETESWINEPDADNEKKRARDLKINVANELLDRGNVAALALVSAAYAPLRVELTIYGFRCKLNDGRELGVELVAYDSNGLRLAPPARAYAP